MLIAAWRSLSCYVPRRWLRTTFVIVLAVTSSLVEAGVLVLVVRAALAVADGVDRVAVGVGHGQLSVGTVLALAAVLAVVAMATRMTLDRMIAVMSAHVLRGAREAVLHAFASATWERQSQEREGALQEAVSTLSAQSSQLIYLLVTGVTAAIGLAAVLMSALVIAPSTTLAVILGGGVLFLLLRPLSRITHRRAAKFVRLNSAFNQDVAETSGLAQELRVFGVEAEIADRLGEQAAGTAIAIAETRTASRALSNLYRNSAVLIMIGGIATVRAASGGDLAGVAGVALLTLRALSYSQQAQSTLQQVYELAPNLSELDRRIEDLRAAREPPGTRIVESIGAVQFAGVSYSYAPDRQAVQELSFEIGPGELLGVVGPSGSGKSTLVQLLLRLRRPTNGCIIIGGAAYNDIDATCWSRLVTLVPQEPRMFQGTVEENIIFHRTGISSEAARQAARASHILEEVEQLPAGFATPLGPRGTGLSGGQRQRLAIARALVGDPQLLVMDEPTSALDVHSEELLQQTIKELKGRVSMVIVAHRLSTIEHCDRVMILDHGRIVALGGRDEVSAHAFLRSGIGGLEAATAPPRQADA